MNLDDGGHHVRGIVPDGIPLPVFREFDPAVTGSVQVRLWNQDGLHVIEVFDLPAQLFSHTPDVLKGVVGRPAFLAFHAPTHGLEHVVRPVPILFPAFSRVVVVRNGGKTPADLIRPVFSNPGRDSDRLQLRHGTDSVDGSLGCAVNATEDGPNHFLAGLLEEVTDDVHFPAPTSPSQASCFLFPTLKALQKTRTSVGGIPALFLQERIPARPIGSWILPASGGGFQLICEHGPFPARCRGCRERMSGMGEG